MFLKLGKFQHGPRCVPRRQLSPTAPALAPLGAVWPWASGFTISEVSLSHAGRAGDSCAARGCRAAEHLDSRARTALQQAGRNQNGYTRQRLRAPSRGEEDETGLPRRHAFRFTATAAWGTEGPWPWLAAWGPLHTRAGQQTRPFWQLDLGTAGSAPICLGLPPWEARQWRWQVFWGSPSPCVRCQGVEVCFPKVSQEGENVSISAQGTSISPEARDHFGEKVKRDVFLSCSVVFPSLSDACCLLYL